MRDNPAPYWAAEHGRALAPSPTGEGDGKPSPPPKGPRTGAELWAKARVVKTQVTLTPALTPSPTRTLNPDPNPNS